MKNILITGGTGLVGTKLTDLLLEKGYDVRHLGRKNTQSSSVKKYHWDIATKTIDEAAIAWANFIIHLAGAPVADKKWSNKRKDTLYSSRVDSTQLLIDTIQNTSNTVQKIVSASGINYYGTITNEKIYTENDTPDKSDFLARLCIDWEKPVLECSIPHVILRVGIVLDAQGGALKKMTMSPLINPLASGKHYMPWIHIEDLCNLFLFSIQDKNSGIYNAVAPEHINNIDFSKELAKAKKRIFLPINVPSFVLKLILGELAEILINGSRVSADKIISKGFKFKHETLKEALNNLFH